MVHIKKTDVTQSSLIFCSLKKHRDWLAGTGGLLRGKSFLRPIQNFHIPLHPHRRTS